MEFAPRAQPRQAQDKLRVLVITAHHPAARIDVARCRSIGAGVRPGYHTGPSEIQC